MHLMSKFVLAASNYLICTYIVYTITIHIVYIYVHTHMHVHVYIYIYAQTSYTYVYTTHQFVSYLILDLVGAVCEAYCIFQSYLTVAFLAVVGCLFSRLALAAVQAVQPFHIPLADAHTFSTDNSKWPFNPSPEVGALSISIDLQMCIHMYT